MSNVLERGIEAHQRGDLAEAQRLYTQTVGVAIHNLGVLDEQAGKHAEAQRRYREALAVDPGRDESAYALALSLLRDGRYAEAWPLHERRRGLARLNLPKPPPAWPEWKGEPIAGKRLAVVGEQGFGDQIMFARFLAPVRAMGAEVRFICAPELISLLQGQAKVTRADFDVWCLQGSLPHLLKTMLETLPPPAAMPLERRGGGGVGVMVAGNPGYLRDRERTPPEEVRAALLSLGRDLRPEATGARDFLETARIVAELDLVVTVDTSMAHLAASIGVPTWVLLPHTAADWRWLRERTDSPWYPAARLLRQPAPGDWHGLLDAVRKALPRR